MIIMIMKAPTSHLYYLEHHIALNLCIYMIKYVIINNINIYFYEYNNNILHVMILIMILTLMMIIIMKAPTSHLYYLEHHIALSIIPYLNKEKQTINKL